MYYTQPRASNLFIMQLPPLNIQLTCGSYTICAQHNAIHVYFTGP